MATHFGSNRASTNRPIPRSGFAANASGARGSSAWSWPTTPFAWPTWSRLKRRTVVVLGHERFGLPDQAWDHLDEVIEIPMIGTGSSLNLAVAGSLVLYKLAGLS